MLVEHVRLQETCNLVRIVSKLYVAFIKAHKFYYFITIIIGLKILFIPYQHLLYDVANCEEYDVEQCI